MSAHLREPVLRYRHEPEPCLVSVFVAYPFGYRESSQWLLHSFLDNPYQLNSIKYYYNSVLVHFKLHIIDTTHLFQFTTLYLLLFRNRFIQTGQVIFPHNIQCISCSLLNALSINISNLNGWLRNLNKLQHFTFSQFQRVNF